MATDYGTRNCSVCKKPFQVRTRNHEHAKYCSKTCQRSAQRGAKTGGKAPATCLNCGKAFEYYPSQGPGKFCSRACRDEHWKKPSVERGFEDLTGKTFGRWTVISHAGRYQTHHAWNVRCSCPESTEQVVTGQSLKSGMSQSCGCIGRGVGLEKPATKQCTRCGQDKPYDAEHFPKSKNFKIWGLKPICLECWHPIARKRHLAWRRKLKLEVLSHYSNGTPKCICCGEEHIEFLSLDHVNNDGKEDRRIHGIGMIFYARMKRLGYPGHLQVMCLNCNLARAFFGECPHRKQL